MSELLNFKLPADDLPDPEIEATRNHIDRVFNTKYDTRLVYHNFQRCIEIDQKISGLGMLNGFSENTIRTARQAGWFYGLGFLIDHNNPGPAGIIAARKFFVGLQYTPDAVNNILSCLQSLTDENPKEQPEAKLLSDGINSLNASETFFTQRQLLRLEWALFSNKKLLDIEWAQLQLQDLLKIRFFTPKAKVLLEPTLARNILQQKKKLNKLNRNLAFLEDEDGHIPKFQHLEQRLPERATQTFFRANYRNHINLSAIADNKANIMISINAILISVLISLLTYKNITETNPMVLLPVVIFLVTGLTSLIFAVLSIRPKITSLNEDKTKLDDIKKNIVFFGNFVHLSLEQYEEAMDAVYRDSQLMYGNMTRDMYYLGQVLDKKYRYLTMSYNIFMVGFVAVVMTFLITLLS